ncbi:hypothetical protein C8F04DRAFT_956737, partial [Mycena alexandri]
MAGSKEEAAEAEAADDAEWKVYTDGSGIEGCIGGAAVLYRGGEEVASARIYLGRAFRHTVFEGEGVGGGLAMWLVERQAEVKGRVTVVVDSQPAVRATQTAASTPSHWIWDVWEGRARAVRRRHPEAMVTVRWAPGHVGIVGNERADEEAKKAAINWSSSLSGDFPRAFRGELPWSKSAVRQDFNAELKEA